LGKFFSLEIISPENKKIKFYFEYIFGTKLENTIHKANALFWILQKIRMKEGGDSFDFSAKNTQKQ
jgi:hypothetical protein